MIWLGFFQLCLWGSQIPVVLFFYPDLAKSIPYVVCISLAANIIGALSWIQSAVTEKRQLELQEQIDNS